MLPSMAFTSRCFLKSMFFAYFAAFLRNWSISCWSSWMGCMCRHRLNSIGKPLGFSPVARNFMIMSFSFSVSMYSLIVNRS